jgi:hypothetical protein
MDTIELNDGITEIKYSDKGVRFIIGYYRKSIPKLFLPSLIFAISFLLIFDVLFAEIIIMAMVLILILTALIQIREVEFDKTESSVTSRYIIWGIGFKKKILAKPMEKFKYEIKYREIDNSETPTIKGYQLSGKRGNNEIDIILFNNKQDLGTVIGILRDSLKLEISIK